jgi:hypothetical protein
VTKHASAYLHIIFNNNSGFYIKIHVKHAFLKLKEWKRWGNKIESNFVSAEE